MSTPFRPQLEPLGERITPSHMAMGLNQGQLISALNTGAAQLRDVSSLSNLTPSAVNVVNVNDVLHGVPAFDNALARDMAAVTALQNFLTGGTVAALTQALSTSNVAISTVVALDVLAGGGVVLFHQ
jgi:hypothetical protein